jgi:hypothetical protein
VERNYRYGANAYSIGFDNYFGAWGVGSSLLSQSFKIDRKIGDNDLRILKDRDYHLRFHLIWQIQESRKVDFYLKPFYQFSLGEYDLTGLADDLNATGYDTSMKPSMFGVTIVFYNGRQ